VAHFSRPKMAQFEKTVDKARSFKAALGKAGESAVKLVLDKSGNDIKRAGSRLLRLKDTGRQTLRHAVQAQGNKFFSLSYTDCGIGDTPFSFSDGFVMLALRHAGQRRLRRSAET